MQAGMQAGNQAEFQKLAVDRNIQFLLCIAKVLHCFSNFNAFAMLF